MTETGVDSKQLPHKWCLNPAFPNPFNPITTIHYALPKQTRVFLGIINLQGQMIRTLRNSILSRGDYHILWDGLNDKGIPVTSGVYLIQLRSEEISFTQKVVLLR